MKRMFETLREAVKSAGLRSGVCSEGMAALELITRDMLIPTSWGMKALRAIPGGIAFWVEGFLYMGEVEVTSAGGGLWRVALPGDGPEAVQDATDGTLADTIDRMVEYDGNYGSNIMDRYGFLIVADSGRERQSK